MRTQHCTLTLESFTGKQPVGIKMRIIGYGTYGGYNVELCGDKVKLIKYAKRCLGVNKDTKTLDSAQSQINANTGS